MYWTQSIVLKFLSAGRSGRKQKEEELFASVKNASTMCVGSLHQCSVRLQASLVTS